MNYERHECDCGCCDEETAFVGLRQIPGKVKGMRR